jgi:hypothetical protein
MMKFSADQVKSLRRSADDVWIDDLCRHLRDHHGEAVAPLDDPALRERVAAGIARARAHGLSARSRVGFFVALLFEIGPSFDEHPRVRQVLAGPVGGRPQPPGAGKRSPDERLASLTSVLTREEWEEASRIPPPARLFP